MVKQKGPRNGRGLVRQVAPAQPQRMRKVVAIMCAMAGFAARAEVISITLGVDVNSPYGISEPWVTIREGLLRLDYVESVAALPDRKSATGELRTKSGRAPDVDALSTAIRELGAGAKLRGVEATVAGDVVKHDGCLMLKVAATGETLRLAPLTTPVQRGADVSEAERNAFAELTSRSKGTALKVRITGPLRARDASGAHQILEVRVLDFPKRPQNETKNQQLNIHPTHSPHNTDRTCFFSPAFGLLPALVHAKTSGRGA